MFVMNIHVRPFPSRCLMGAGGASFLACTHSDGGRPGPRTPCCGTARLAENKDQASWIVNDNFSFFIILQFYRFYVGFHLERQPIGRNRLGFPNQSRGDSYVDSSYGKGFLSDGFDQSPT
ncbi:hypothetical protein ABLE93_21330 [Xanthobacter sp. KR7-65]|uniref:hypothetical protein n=1 Tax=Xanthobacter sp. KR7-65 TaxID=3156612 RepID=UPI0032B4648F